MDDLPTLSALYLRSESARSRNRMDRYREFRQVFLGTEAGQRVFDDILHQCRFADANHAPADGHSSTYWNGRRSVAISLLRILYDEPNMEPPTRQIITEE